MIKKISQNKFILSLLAGALCALSFAPFHFFIAAIISVSVFWFLLEKKCNSTKEAAWLGMCYGFGYFVAGIYWVAISMLVDAAKFAWLIPFSLTLLPGFLALYSAGLAACYKKINQKFLLKNNYQKILLFALLWLVAEVLRSFIFTGFPWNLLGYSLMFNDAVMQSAAFIGVYGLSFFAVLFCLTPILLYNGLQNSNHDKIFAAILAILFAVNFIYGYQHLQNSKIVEHKETKLRLVQGNIKQNLKWDPIEKYRNFTKHIDLTNEQDKSDVAAVIWSETAVPYVIDNEPKLMQELYKATPPNGVLITGALRVEYEDETKQNAKNVWNSVFTLSQNGVVNYYDKHHLVPFGEYVPFAKYLPFIEKITGGAVGFGEGNGPKTLEAQGFSYSPLICYEVIFSNKIVDRNHRPDLLVNATNDAWFGYSSGPFQHFDMAKMRAVEQGISLARAANTGISAYIDPLGREVARLNLNKEGVIDVNLIEKTEATIFARFCYWPLTFMALVIAAFLLITTKRKNERTT